MKETRLPEEKKKTIAGGLAAGMGAFIVTPTEILKSRAQANRTRHKLRYSDIVRQIVRTEGSKGLFRGLHLALMRDVPIGAIIFGFYEAAK